MLTRYRVLDLTDEKGLLCGKVLGDLGADVIKVEPPGGARRIGPFYHDIPDVEKSLFWFAYNTSKRGITLNIETRDGQEIFKKLVKTADVIIESYPPGYMERLGLGYEIVSEVNPGIIVTSITPHGQTGPYREFKTYDLQAQAMSGIMYSTGYPDGPPLQWPGAPAYTQAGLQAAVGTIFALFYRETSGEGQCVDVSIRESMLVLSTTQAPALKWLECQEIVSRLGSSVKLLDRIYRLLYPCKDGYITWRLMFGPVGRGTNALVKWMEEEGMAGDLQSIGDWTKLGISDKSQEEISHWEQIFAKFFLTHTKKELLNGALERGIILYPVSNIADILANPQLASRNYFTELSHPELEATITYPGAFFKASVTPCKLRRRAPLVGEHNQEIFVGELGLSEEELLILKENNVI